MKIYLNLLAASALLTILNPSAVRADDSILSFELSPPQWAATAPATEAVATVTVPDPAHQLLPIPARATNPPMRYHSPQQLPAGVYRRGVAVALNDSSATDLLPPAPPLPEAVIMVATALPKPQAVPQAKADPDRLILDFAVEPSAAMAAMAAAQLAASQLKADPLPSLFDGHSNSLVARAVGSAEGTRAPNGSINPAYFGHTDPGNRVWNLGTFSYQHGAKTPEEADQKQLARLQTQGDVLRRRALQHGLNLTLEETLNGLDLANQSPLAAIGRVGYIERLAEAKANGLEGSEAILVARTRSYINPNTGRWNAPGLGNTEASIRRDQQRRAQAVAQAIAAYEAQNPQLQAQSWTLIPNPEPEPEALIAGTDTPAEPVDDFLRMWTGPSDPVAQVAPGDDSSLVGQSSEAEPPPTWKDVREGHQTAAVPEVRATEIPGALPDTTVYVPEIPSEPGTIERSLADVAAFAAFSDLVPALVPVAAKLEAEPTDVHSGLKSDAPAGGPSKIVSANELPPPSLERLEPVQLALDSEAKRITQLFPEVAPIQPALEPERSDVLSFAKIDTAEAFPAETLMFEAGEAKPAKPMAKTGEDTATVGHGLAEPESSPPSQVP